MKPHMPLVPDYNKPCQMVETIAQIGPAWYRYYPQIICVNKLEARSLFFLNFKGTPSQEEHTTIFSGLS
jgi:hypothetical protein